ncbi:hypothetical protein FOA52_003674 [Chlamydomonas sp. UWO 241]|nr:hypothetical protein FOA52_003674 [Chlamydomonas sp. UWO 241]
MSRIEGACASSGPTSPAPAGTCTVGFEPSPEAYAWSGCDGPTALPEGLPGSPVPRPESADVGVARSRAAPAAATGQARPAWGAGAVQVNTLIKSLWMPRVREGSMSGAVTPLTLSATKAESARLHVSGVGPAAAADVVDLPSTELSQHLMHGRTTWGGDLMHGRTAWGGDIDAHATGCATPTADHDGVPAVVPAVLLTRGSSDTGADSALYAIEGAGLLGTGMQSLSYETSLTGETLDPYLAFNNPDEFKRLLREQLAVIFGIDPSTIDIGEVIVDTTSATPIVVTGLFVADQTGTLNALTANVQAMQADSGVRIEDRGSAGLLVHVLIPSDAIRAVASKLSAMYAIEGAGLLGTGLSQLMFSTEITGVDPALAASNEDAFRSLVATEHARVFNLTVSQVRIDRALVTPGTLAPLVVAGALIPPATDLATPDVDGVVALLRSLPANANWPSHSFP